MAQIRGRENIEAASQSGQNKYFKLENDKDKAEIRFLYKDVEDIEATTIHTIVLNGKERKIDCLGDKTNCPLCAAGKDKQAKLFLNVENLTAGEIQMWERPSSFLSTIISYAERIKSKELCGTIWEIQRDGAKRKIGEKGGKPVNYLFFNVESDETTMDDFGEDEMPQIMGSLILQKTAEEIEYFLDHGDFPKAEGAEEGRRSGARSSGRRMPADTKPAEKEPVKEDDPPAEPSRRERREPARTTTSETPSRRRKFN